MWTPNSFLIGVVFYLTTPFLFSQTEHTGNILFLSDSEIGLYNTSDSIKSNIKKDKPFRMKKSPLIATLLSVAIPGAGQFYNQSYWKVPIILGLCGYLGYEVYRQDKKYRDYRDQYITSQQQFPPDGDLNLKSLRQFYFDQRNDFIWYFVIAYVVNLVDAYVDAHLFDFDVKEEKIERLGIIDRKVRLKLKLDF